MSYLLKPGFVATSPVLHETATKGRTKKKAKKAKKAKPKRRR